MKGWARRPLAQLASRISDGSHNPPKGVEMSGFMMLSSKNVFDDQLSFDAPRYLSAADFKTEDRRTFVSAGDVLLTIVGTIGRTAVVPTDAPAFTLQRSVAVIRPDRSVVDSRFLMYALMSGSEALNAQARGVAQKGIYLEALREFGIDHPPLPEQRRVVSILDEAFEGIATAKANAEKNLQNARELFETYLGATFAQEGEVVQLSKCATAISDGDHAPPPKSPTGVPFITISNVDKETRRIDFNDTFTVSREYFDALKPHRKPKNGDVLYTVTGSFGIPVLVQDDGEFCFQRHIGLIRPKSDIDSRWLMYALLSPQVRAQAEAGATGTAQRTVSLGVLRAMTVPKIGVEEQRRIAARIDALNDEVGRLKNIARAKLAALDELKKSLLHQAFTGAL